MNRLSEVFANHRCVTNSLLLWVGLGLGLSACSTASLMTSTKTNPSSSAAGQVDALALENTPFPTFQGIPAAPSDVRALNSWGDDARQVESLRVQLERDTAPETWTLNATERFAAQARSRIDLSPALAVSTAAETEAFARALRKRATPPPPPKR